MAVSTITQKDLDKQERKSNNIRVKLRGYLKVLTDAAIAFQTGFAKEFQDKFEQLKNATFTFEEVDFDKIKMNQVRAEQVDLENIDTLTGYFEFFGFLTTQMFPIVVVGFDKIYELITGYHRIKIFKEKYKMKRSWFLVFRLPADVRLTKLDKRDMGNVANPLVVGGKPFQIEDIAYSVVARTNEEHGKISGNLNELKIVLKPFVNQEIEKYDKKYGAFGFASKYYIDKTKKEVLQLAIKAFNVITEIRVFTEDEIDKLVKKTQKGSRLVVAPRGTLSNWKDMVVRTHSNQPGKFDLVCNFTCHGNSEEYANLQQEFYFAYMEGIMFRSFTHWLNEYEMGFGGEREDLERIVKYFRQKVNFKYFSPMHPKSPKSKLVLTKDVFSNSKTNGWWKHNIDSYMKAMN